MTKISIVVPVYNEEGNVANLHQEVKQVMEKSEYEYEIIFIDDGSTDSTLAELKTLQPVKIIRFRRNFGQTAALDVGIKTAKGELIVTLDGDGQNDPADIPALIQKLERDKLDVVSGWRKNRQDNLSKKLCSWMAARLRKKLINDGIHDSGCTLKAYRAECFRNVDLTGEMHRFIPGVLKIKGFKIGEIEVNHRPRTNGHTKYNWKRGLKGILDMISVWFWKKYANRPLHLFGGVGFLVLAVSVIAGLWVIYKKLAFNVDLSDHALTNLSMFGFLIGIQFIVFGLLADILAKSYFASTKDTVYDIKEFIEK